MIFTFVVLVLLVIFLFAVCVMVLLGLLGLWVGDSFDVGDAISEVKLDK